jgi:hypothetical protein
VRLVVELPPVPRELSPNVRMQALHRAPHVAKYREDARLAALAAGAPPEPWECVVISISFGTANCRKLGVWMPRDRDNALASLKAGIDGIRDAKVFVDDSAKHVSYGNVLFVDTWGPGVRIIVERVE